jgi:anthranilate synthase component I
VFQVVPSQRLSADLGVHPFAVYRALRTINPSPYLGYLDLGPVTLVASSPESLVRAEGRRVETRPIAGTRRRGATPAEDEALAAELAPTPRSAPSTSCSSTSAATTWAASAGPAAST